MPHFDKPTHGWNPPVKITLPIAYEQYKARNQAVEDPFAACARNAIPPPGVSPYDDNAAQQTYASDHPSLTKWSMGRNLTNPKSLKLDRDEVRSDWETIVGDDEGDSRMTSPPAPQVTLKSLGIIPNNPESILADGNGNDINEDKATCNNVIDPKGKGKEPAFPRPGTPFDAFGFSKTPEVLEPHSQVMDMEASYTPSPAYCGHTGFVRQPVHGGLGGGLSRPKASKASSDESTDLFKYDGEAYSTFLHRSTTRDIAKRHPAASFEDDRLFVQKTRTGEEDKMHSKIPVGRGQQTLYEPSTDQSPEPAVEEEEEEEFWPRVGGNDAAAEADWQTVTTGPVCKGLNTSDLNLIKDTGSSLADVSDIVEEEPTPVEHRRAAGTISHQRNQSIHRPKGYYAEDFAQATTRMNNNHASSADYRPQKFLDGTARLAAPRAVNPFQTPPSWKSTGRVIELDDSPENCTCKGKGKAVDTNVGITTRADAPPLNRTESTETVWPQVPRRDETVNDFDQAFCETRIGDETLPSDDSANVFSRLPFSLIDLKEAAKTHGSQRFRGTDEANNFAQRARLGPLWSGSTDAGPSTEAGPSSGAYRLGGSDNPPLERPSTAVFRDQITRGRPTHEFDGIEDSTPSPSSAILGSLRSKVNLGFAKKKEKEKSTYSLDPFKAAAALGAKCLRIKAPAKKKDQWPTARNQTGGVLTPSEAELIESARGEIMDRRRSPEKLEKKRTFLFILIMASSIVFPFIGFIALIRKFDSSVAWFTYGEIKDFTKEQRGMLLQQLLVEIFVYSIVIICVALRTSHHI
ncbi:hypothetical protein V8C44DRAFT_364200 [Trichoderma aethiopicum]